MKPRGTSEAEEMYLVTVARAAAGAGEPVPMRRLVGDLAVSPAAAGEMVHKLETRGLLVYEPYRGIRLTATGREVARGILRSRRLWSRFLVEHLRVDADSAEAIACDMEHLTPAAVADRLEAYLETVSPPGSGRAGSRLGAASVGDRVRVERLVTDATTGGFLERVGIRPGSELTVTGLSPDGSVLLEVEGRPVALAGVVADGVVVETVP